MLKTALLIIDVQVAMFESEQEAPYKGGDLLDHIALLLAEARKQKMPVVYIQHTESEGEFEEGKHSWEIHPAIAPLPGESVIQKRSWDAFLNTTLDETLKQLGIQRLIIAGMQTEFCVDTSLRRAYSMGYQNIVVQDAHSTFDSPVLEASRIIAHHAFIWNGRFAKLMPTQDALNKIRGEEQ